MTSLCVQTSTMECIQQGWLCNGIYVFQREDTTDVLYVGRAAKQPLARRFSQHFSWTDSGATFFANWKERHPSKSFKDFQKVLTKCKLKLIYIDESKSTKTQEMVKELECALLQSLPKHLQPKYNKEKSRKWSKKYISQECINAIVDYLRKSE